MCRWPGKVVEGALLRIRRVCNRSIRMVRMRFRSLLRPRKEAGTSMPLIPSSESFSSRKFCGMAFPYDFGFIPSTIADDGDPVDVLVLMDEPAFPGCLLGCRPIGIIEGEQGKKKPRERNDRIVAVEDDNHSYAHVKHIRDLGKEFIKELEEFFVDYHRLSGKQYRILGIRGPREAKKHVKDGVKEAKQGA